jgi:hypothetical protein
LGHHQPLSEYAGYVMVDKPCRGDLSAFDVLLECDALAELLERLDGGAGKIELVEGVVVGDDAIDVYLQSPFREFLCCVYQAQPRVHEEHD